MLKTNRHLTLPEREYENTFSVARQKITFDLITLQHSLFLSKSPFTLDFM